MVILSADAVVPTRFCQRTLLERSHPLSGGRNLLSTLEFGAAVQP